MKLNKEAISNLEQNKRVSTSLKSYASDMTVLTYHAGIVLAAMNGYGMYDRVFDEEMETADSIKAYFVRICQLIKGTVFTRCRGMMYQMNCGILENLRNEIILEAQKAEQDEELLDQYASLLEFLNPLYAAFLVTPLAGKPEKEISPCKELLALIEQAAQEESCGSLEEKAMPYLIEMEGLQERYYQPLYRYQLAFSDIDTGFSAEIQKKELTGSFSVLSKTSKLLSSSPFASLS